MGNQNKNNRRIADDERNRSNNEFGAANNFAMGPGGDFGQGMEANSRRMTEQGFSGGQTYTPAGIGGPNGNGFGGASGGGDVNFEAAKAGDFGSARAGYENFASTGGVDGTALRQRATAQIPGFYNNYKQAAQRRSSVQGGYSPGFDAQQAEIGRQAGREGFEASRQVEGDIADKTQMGKLQGLSGLTNLGGMDQQLNMYNQGQNQSLGMFNSSQRQANNQFNAGLSDRALDRSQQDRQFGAEFGEGQRQFNSRGWAGLNDQDFQRTGRNQGAYLQGIGGRNNAALGALGYRQASSPDRMGQLIGMGGQLGASAIGAFGPRRGGG